ncbi:MAG: hypothetical protein HYY13_03910 [Nitrospirae bacterium]|nr:hypothetical protein [Nitrospirota bacterium]
MKSLFAKSALIGAGLTAGSLAALALAVTVGTIKTWTSGETLTASDLNTTISSLKTAIEGIPNWTKSGSDAVYTDGKVGIGTAAPAAPIHVTATLNNSGSTSYRDTNNALHVDNQSSADGATAYLRMEVVGDGYHLGTLRNTNDDVDFVIWREVTSSGNHFERFRISNGADVKAAGKYLAFSGSNAVPVTADSTQQLIQRGRACEATPSSNSISVTFSPAFSALPTLVGTFDNNSAGHGTPNFLFINYPQFTTSGATFAQDADNSSTTSCVQWIAIGPK